MSNRGVYKYCKIQKKVVPIDEVIDPKHANVAHGYIPDDMPATKHPLDGRYYTSKARFREVTKLHGYEEVGTAYENGYEPEENKKYEERKYNQRLKERFREYLNRGRN